MPQSTLNNLYPNEYSREFHYYPFSVDVLEVVLLGIIYLIKYVFQIKKKI